MYMRICVCVFVCACTCRCRCVCICIHVCACMCNRQRSSSACRDVDAFRSSSGASLPGRRRSPSRRRWDSPGCYRVIFMGPKRLLLANSRARLVCTMHVFIHSFLSANSGKGTAQSSDDLRAREPGARTLGSSASCARPFRRFRASSPAREAGPQEAGVMRVLL